MCVIFVGTSYNLCWGFWYLCWCTRPIYSHQEARSWGIYQSTSCRAWWVKIFFSFNSCLHINYSAEILLKHNLVMQNSIESPCWCSVVHYNTIWSKIEICGGGFLDGLGKNKLEFTKKDKIQICGGGFLEG